MCIGTELGKRDIVRGRIYFSFATTSVIDQEVGDGESSMYTYPVAVGARFETEERPKGFVGAARRLDFAPSDSDVDEREQKSDCKN